MPGYELRIHGYRALLNACDAAPKAAKREVRQILRDAGEVVRRDAVHRFDAYSPKSAHGYRTVVRKRGINIEQSLRKVDGKRPDWGSQQMRKALLPALEHERHRFEEKMEHALDLVRDVFEYHSY